MQAFDASSIVYAWDNYPIVQFPGLWDWMARQINNQNIAMPSTAVKEVSEVSPDCSQWLSLNNISVLPLTNAIAQEALRIKKLLGIVGEKYGNKGVDEKDLLIIACARESHRSLVSNESVQSNKPNLMQNYKIPAVCSMQTVNVKCIDFLEFIKQSQVVFG